MKAKSSRVMAIAVVAFGLALPAIADTTLHYQVSRGESTAPMVLKARDGEIRIEGAAIGRQFQWMVFRSAENTLYAVDPQRRIYLALDQAAIERIAQQMDAMRADLRKRIKKMPIGKRKFVESQIGDFIEQSENGTSEMKIKMDGAEAKVNDIACRTGRITTGGQPAGTLCVASTDALGLTNAEFDAYQGLYSLINGLQTAMSGDAASAPDLATLRGVPVSMAIESSGVAQTLEEIEHQPLPDDLFEIPQRYERRDPQDLMR